MDNKKMFGAMAVVVLLIIGYSLFLTKYYAPKHPEFDWNGTANKSPINGDGKSSGGSSISGPPGSAMSGATTAPSTTPSLGASTTPSSEIQVVGAAAPVPDAIVGSVAEHNPQYSLGLNISSLGAGLNSVTINQAKSINVDVNPKELYSFQQHFDGHDDLRPMATKSVTVNGQKFDVWNVPWQLESPPGAASATYGINIISTADARLLHLTKTFSVEPYTAKNHDNTHGGYEVSVIYHVQNLTGMQQTVRIAFNGPTMPPREIERSDDRQIVAGYDAGSGSVDVVRYALTDFKAGVDVKDMSVSPKGYKFLWGGESSVYFGAVVRPLVAGQLEKIVAHALNPDAPPEDRLIAMDFETADLKVDGGAATDIPLKFFCGPKERSMLEGDYYSAYPLQFNQLLGTSSFCGICTVGWLVDRLVDLLTFFHWILKDWGLAIILLVVIVRSLLHPITKSSQVSMLKMQKMGPELERLKKKHGDDKEAYTKAQMQIYKQMGFTPILGCLPMLLQMPIWIALYSALQNEYRLRQEPFLWGLTWIHDLARPDRLIAWDAHAFMIPLIGMRIASLNVLPLFMAVVFFLQQKYTPKPPAATPEQAQQQKMMQWMSLLFPVFLYPAPSGLNLYILTSTAIGVIESKRIRDHIKQQQALETSGQVIVDAKPSKHDKLNKQKADANYQPKKVGFLTSLWANMQAKVEELRDEAEKKKPK
jgi:YidC/Oxa1 family membrane protein insertase